MMRFEERLAALGFASYEEYLRSPHWMAFKKLYWAARKKRVCAVCGDGKIQLHHHNYANLGRESVEDVTPLCDTHHDAVHEWLKQNGATVAATRRAVRALQAAIPRLGPRPKTRRLKRYCPTRSAEHLEKQEAAAKALAVYRSGHQNQLRHILTTRRAA